MFEQK